MDKALYELVYERANGRCEIANCTVKNPRLEVAHLLAKQMGGSKYRDDPENLALFCKVHHDILDGRISPNQGRYELEFVYRAAIRREWKERR